MSRMIPLPIRSWSKSKTILLVVALLAITANFLPQLHQRQETVLLEPGIEYTIVKFNTVEYVNADLSGRTKAIAVDILYPVFCENGENVIYREARLDLPVEKDSHGRFIWVRLNKSLPENTIRLVKIRSNGVSLALFEWNPREMKPPGEINKIVKQPITTASYSQ
ncbi:MAG: hypothetical protein V1838_00700 [Patescibacteria group bacterium]